MQNKKLNLLFWFKRSLRKRNTLSMSSVSKGSNNSTSNWFRGSIRTPPKFECLFKKKAIVRVVSMYFLINKTSRKNIKTTSFFFFPSYRDDKNIIPQVYFNQALVSWLQVRMALKEIKTSLWLRSPKASFHTLRGITWCHFSNLQIQKVID